MQNENARFFPPLRNPTPLFAQAPREHIASP